jgi:uncharacterized protein
MSRALLTTALLFASNAFMTFAWYFHLKKTGWTALMAIGLSWLMALPEYALQVPANRLGHLQHGGVFTAPQLKILQEGVTLVVFAAFSTWVLKERLRWSDAVGFALVFLGVLVSMAGKR